MAALLTTIILCVTGGFSAPAAHGGSVCPPSTVTPAGNGTEAFAYNLLGNRKTATDRQGRQSSYQHNWTNEYASITVASQVRTPVHDAACNLTTTENDYQLVYDYENRLVQVKDKNANHSTLATYTYDALGHRVKQVKAGQTTLYYYDGETVLAEYSGSGSLQRYHVHGPTYVDEHVLLHEVGQGGSPDREYYYLLTSLYSVSGLANASGAVVERYRYDTYGQPTWMGFGNFNGDDKIDMKDFLVFQTAFSGDAPCTDAARICDYNGDGKVNLEDYRGFNASRTASTSVQPISPFRFTGQRLDFQISDTATGRPMLVLYHFRARAYDAYNGRFLQRDRLLYVDSMNLYEYCKSRPMDASDPYGEWTALEVLGAQGAIGAITGMLTSAIFHQDPIRGLQTGAMAGLGGGLAFLSGAGIIAMGAVSGLVSGATDAYLRDPLLEKEGAVTRLATDAIASGILGGLSAGLLQKMAPVAVKLGLAVARSDTANPGPQVFKYTLTTSKGLVDVMADVRISGSTLSLQNMSVFGRDEVLTGLTGELLQGRNELVQAARLFGFRSLRISGVRVPHSTSANPGKVVDIVIDLTKP